MVATTELPASKEIDPGQAEILHHTACRQGFLPMWTIYWSPKDYPDQAVTRMFTIGRRPEGGTTEPQCEPYVMVAPSVDTLREKLPYGLVCLTRDPADDPNIVESWF